MSHCVLPTTSHCFNLKNGFFFFLSPIPAQVLHFTPITKTQLGNSKYKNRNNNNPVLVFIIRNSAANNKPRSTNGIPVRNSKKKKNMSNKNLLNPRREKLPPEFVLDEETDPQAQLDYAAVPISTDSGRLMEEGNEEWSPDEMDAVYSLFRGRIPQKPYTTSQLKLRPLPLPLPHKIRPLRYPTPKNHLRSPSSLLVASSRGSLCKKLYKNPEFLIKLARDIKGLPAEKDVSEVLDNWSSVLRKGSLSLTIRELGHMGLDRRALQTFNWAEKRPHLFPDDRSLASIVEILARNSKLELPKDMDSFTSSASETVMEAMARGFVKSGNHDLACKLLSAAKDAGRTLDAGVYAKLIAEVAKMPCEHGLAESLLNELGDREDMKLKQQDCTALMKACINLKRFDVMESLFTWFKDSGRCPSVVMYTTLVHGRHCSGNYREAMAAVWEMENLDMLLDIPAYSVVIRLCAALNDLSRAVRYYSRLKDAGFSPTYDIYRQMIRMYAQSGRIAKCRELCKEVELEGFVLDEKTAVLFV